MKMTENKSKIVFLLLGLVLIYAGIDMLSSSVDYGTAGLIVSPLLVVGGIFMILMALKTESLVILIDKIVR